MASNDNKKDKPGFLDRRLLAFYNSKVPPISETERIALESGDVCFEGSLLAGQPDWKTLVSMPPPRLSAEEQAFLDGPVEEYCKMLDSWQISEGDEQDMPQEAWDFAREHKFFGMGIPREHGGLGFSELAHSAVIKKIASRSFSGAVNIMVPNSLGPGALVTNYGTAAQKKKYLENLADGTEVPCFALTEPNAGSDATSIEAKGVVVAGENPDDPPKIRLNFEKRYITLAPIATLVGLAFQLEDPDNLLGKGENPGITVALLPRNTPGMEIGGRHRPMDAPFNNGPIFGKDVEISVDNIIGEKEGVGKGWKMLVECLSVGRAISLPAVSAGGMELCSRTAGAYSHIRSQFGLAVGKFEGVEEVLARIAGLTYLSDATREFTVQYLDEEHKRPAIPGAIAKYHLTENLRTVLRDAMDIEGGKAIMKGPGNHLAGFYEAMPIAITVEGANIMTRNLIIFGQGAMRSHPYLLDQLAAAGNDNKAEGAKQLKKLLWEHGKNIAVNAYKARKYGKDSDASSYAPVEMDVPTRKYYGQINRLSSAFNFASNVALLHIGGGLKRKERLSARLGDAMSHLYMASASLRRFENDGRPSGDLPLVRWACEHSLHHAEKALADFVDNYPQKHLSWIMKKAILPKGQTLKAPSDKLEHEVAGTIYNEGPVRDRLTKGIYIPAYDPDKIDPVADIDYALEKVTAAEKVKKEVAKAVRDGKIEEEASYEKTLLNAEEMCIIGPHDTQVLQEAEAARRKVVMVDHFARNKKRGFGM